MSHYVTPWGSAAFACIEYDPGNRIPYCFWWSGVNYRIEEGVLRDPDGILRTSNEMWMPHNYRVVMP